MRTPALLTLLLLLTVGCTAKLSPDALVERYTQTVFADGVVSVVPAPGERDQPPTVVNWWYTGDWNRYRYVVYRELTWDDEGEPVGRERWYRVPEEALAVVSPFSKTDDASRWLALYEALGGLVPPPSDLDARRDVGGPVSVDPLVTPIRRDPSDAGPLPPGTE